MRNPKTGTFPSQVKFYHAILRHLASRTDGDNREAIHAAMPDLLNLSEDQRRERLANLPHLRYRHRSGWGLSMLKAAGFVDSPSRGIWRITERGRALLAEYPDAFDDDTGRRLLREARPPAQPDGKPEPPDPINGDISTPDERIDAAVQEMCRAVAAELLEQISKMPPASFEVLVLDLLHSLGYGTREEDLQRVGSSGDGGIDGIITLDRLGFEKVYVQAKRWQGSVGRPEIQAFFGALAARRAKKGVFITTSTFTREARDYEGHVAKTVVLIDGTRLTSLMIEFGVGVTHRTIRLPRVDSDYFERE